MKEKSPNTKKEIFIKQFLHLFFLYQVFN